MQQAINDMLTDITKLRQQLHQHPELKYEEYETAKLVVNCLQEYGYQDIKTGIGKTGVTTLLDSGKPGKTIALRADMDALPMTETTNLSYQSQNKGVMHACGHDGHTATLLGVAKLLQDTKPNFNGRVKFIFQPAEEGGAGAKAMIEDGVLDDVDIIFGYHNFPLFDLGVIASREGCLLAGTNEFKITIKGQGGHAALPHLTIDPIIVASQIIQQVQTLNSRYTNPVDPVVVSVTKFHAGTTYNVIADDAELMGTIRTTSNDTRQAVLKQFENIIHHVCQSYGATANIDYVNGFPATMNWPEQHQFVLDTAQQLFGEARSQTMANPIMGGEDFSYYLEKIPGCYFMIGTGRPQTPLHTTDFDYNDEALPTAIRMMSEVAIRYNQQEG